MPNVLHPFDVSARPPRPQGDLDSVVRQEDLEELILLDRRAHEAVEAWKKKKDATLWMLLQGYPVEPGVHTARALSVTRRASSTNGTRYYRLVVK